MCLQATYFTHKTCYITLYCMLLDVSTRNPTYPGFTPTRVVGKRNVDRPTLASPYSATSTPRHTSESENSTPGSSKSRSPDIISKYLVQFVPVKQKSHQQSATRVTGSRVLTSAEGLTMLKEKEDQKKKEAEEKEKRKLERGGEEEVLAKKNRRETQEDRGKEKCK